MIAPLRNRHRGMILILALIVPVVFVLAVTHRPPPPNPWAAAPAIAAQKDKASPNGTVQPAGNLVLDAPQLFDEPSVGAQLLSDTGGATLVLNTQEPLRHPDILVYWAPQGSEGPPKAGSLLLGTLTPRGPRTYHLPESALGRPGQLQLYSLAHQTLVAQAPIPAAGEPLPTAPKGGESDSSTPASEESP